MVAKSVVIACDTFAPDHNGSATFAKNLACTLQRVDHEVHVIAPATSKLYGTFREKHDGVAIIVHRLKSYRLPFHPTQRFVSPIGLTKKISGLIGAIKPDVVHVQSHLNIGQHAANAAVSKKIRLIATNHLDAEHLVENVLLAPKFVKRFLANMLIRDASRVFKAADVVVAPTLRSAQMMQSVTPKLEVLAISGGVDLSAYRGLPVATQSAQTIIYVGRLDREKHVYVLLEALAKLPKTLKLQIIGSGSQQAELFTLAKDLNVSSRVQFFEDLSDQEVIERLGKSSVFVMPSIQELQSMATLEAMAAGRPVIGANSMALPNLVEDGVNGYLFKPDSPQDLAQKLEKVFALDEKTFNGFALASQKKAEGHDLLKTVESYARLYAGDSHLPNIAESDQDFKAEPTIANRLAELMRRGTRGLEQGTNGVIERLDGVRGSVLETFGDVRFNIERRSKRVAKKLSSSLRRALERIRRDD